MLSDLETAPIDEKLRATLRFLQKMTLFPQSLAPQDAQAARAAGVSEAALRDAAHVCYLFSIYNRMAETLKFQTYDEYSLAATMLLKLGY